MSQKFTEQLNPKIEKYVIATILIVCIISTLFAVPAFADAQKSAEEISGLAAGGLRQIYNVFKIAALPIGIIVMAVCGIKMLWGNAKSAEDAKKVLIRIGIAMVIIYLAPILVHWATGLFASKGSDDVIKEALSNNFG